MERTRFNKPVSILVGLGYPAKIHSARQAYEYLLDRPTIAANKVQSVALRVCKAALQGEVDAETARSAFVAFAERNAMLAPESRPEGYRCADHGRHRTVIQPY
jgi:hypothetical protein